MTLGKGYETTVVLSGTGGKPAPGPEDRCPACFEPSVVDGVCLHCSFNLADGRRDPGALPLWSVVGGKYCIGRILGRGGFGITYLAKDLQLERLVALKEYFPSELVARNSAGVELTYRSEDAHAQFERCLKRFFSEGKSLARCTHPNIVGVYEVVREHGTAYLVMEYLEGQTLRKLLEGKTEITVERAIELMKPVCDALAVAHGHGIIHRDVKPDNIYVTNKGRVLLLDFGGAKIRHSEVSIDVMFSPGYGAPEQHYVGSEQIGPWTDVYGAGATLYRMLAGIKLIDPLQRLAQRDPPIEWPDTRVPDRVRATVELAVALDHTQRFQSIEAFAEALRQDNGQDLPLSLDTPEGTPDADVGRAPLLRTPRVFAMGAIALLALALGAFFLTRSKPVAAPAVAATSPPVVAPATVLPSHAEAAAPVDEAAALAVDELLTLAATDDWQAIKSKVQSMQGARSPSSKAGTPIAAPVAQANDAIGNQDYKQAAALLQSRLNEAPDDSDARATLAYVLLRQGQPGAAKHEAQLALGAATKDSGAWATISEALVDEGSHAQALAALKLAVYFAKDRKAMLAYVEEGTFESQAFRQLARQQRSELQHVPEMKW